MKLKLIPQPRKLTLGKGTFLDNKTSEYKITTTHNDKLPAQAYILEVKSTGIRITSSSESGEFYASQTLTQLANQFPHGKIPALRIEDRPDFPERGIYYDVTRGRVPKLERLLELADQLAHYKINQLQLYFEHSFAFPSHPNISKGTSALNAKDILELDDFCRQRHIELIPSIASFGHLSRILAKPQYRHIAEDWGIGKYISPDADKLPSWFKGRKGWSIAPANPDSYEFLASLYNDILPLFSSKRVNVCCDEVFDMGMGQSFELCKKIGKANLYLRHIKKLRQIAGHNKKHIMVWGDMLHTYPEIIASLPKDITILDWGYTHNHSFNKIQQFTQARLKSFACPGTSSWTALFPRIHEAMQNIHCFASAGMKHKATGLLTTDWGDGGHYNFMEYSWHGYLLGAEQGWNTMADRNSFTERFSSQFLNIDSAEFNNAIVKLGDISHLSVSPWYQSIWKHILFAPPDSEIFKPIRRTASICRKGKISEKKILLTSKLGKQTAKDLLAIRKIFRILGILGVTSQHSTFDTSAILKYWIFATDTLICAANKLAVFGAGGKPTPKKRKALKKELKRLKTEFQTLWLSRNRPSELRTTLACYDKAISEI